MLNCRLVWRDSPAVVAVEVVRMVGVVLKDQRLLFDDGVTLLADILAQAAGFLTVMARPTQVPEVRRGAQPRQESELSVMICNVLLRKHATSLHRQIDTFACVNILLFIPASIFDKAHVCKHSLANVAAEAVRVPAVVHGLNDSTDDELT